MFRIICLSVVLMFGLCALGYADEHFPFLAQVSKASVNIRAGANMNFEKLDKINRGAEIVVWGRSFDWYKIQLPITAQAYIRADYLQIRQHLMAEITGDKVHIRARANSDSASLGQLKKGDLVKVIAQTNGWYQIEPPAEAVGWIYKDFLSVKSLTVEPSFIRGPLRLPAQPKSEPPSMPGSLEVKGRS